MNKSGLNLNVKFIKESSKEYFDDAVRLILGKDFKNNTETIIRKFAQSFVIEKGVKEMFVYEYKPKLFDSTTGMSMFNEIYISKKAFQNKKSILDGISLLFHEAEHVKSRTDEDKNSHFKHGVDFPYYANSHFDLYITSPNEHKSRLAEIIYVKKFLERMEYIMETEEEFNTRQNQQLLKRYKREALDRERKIENDYQKGLAKKNDPKVIEQRKKQAQKLLEKAMIIHADRCASFFKINEKNIFNEQQYILDYLKAYKDPEFFTLMMKNIKAFPNLYEKNLLETVSNIYYTENNCDELIFSYPDSGFKFALSGEAYGRHCLLFWGEKPWAAEEQREGLAKVCEELKDFQFKGIPYRARFNLGEPINYQITINGETLTYDTIYEMFLEISKHVNSNDLKNLTPEKIEEINNLFGASVIEYAPVEEEIEEEEDLDPRSKYRDASYEREA